MFIYDIKISWYKSHIIIIRMTANILVNFYNNLKKYNLVRNELKHFEENSVK